MINVRERRMFEGRLAEKLYEQANDFIYLLLKINRDVRTGLKNYVENSK